MVRAYLTSAVAGALLLGMATAALAVTGEYGNMCTMGLALGKDIQTDCSINAQVQGIVLTSRRQGTRVGFDRISFRLRSLGARVPEPALLTASTTFAPRQE